jgi:hypothetical protein
MRGHEQGAPLPASPFPGETSVNLIARLLSRRRSGTIATALERQRLDRTMPGQTGAVLASRHGLFV